MGNDPPVPPIVVDPSKVYFIKIENWETVEETCDTLNSTNECCIIGTAIEDYWLGGGFVPYNELCGEGAGFCCKITDIQGPYDSAEDCEEAHGG